MFFFVPAIIISDVMHFLTFRGIRLFCVWKNVERRAKFVKWRNCHSAIMSACQTSCHFRGNFGNRAVRCTVNNYVEESSNCDYSKLFMLNQKFKTNKQRHQSTSTEGQGLGRWKRALLLPPLSLPHTVDWQIIFRDKLRRYGNKMQPLGDHDHDRVRWREICFSSIIAFCDDDEVLSPAAAYSSLITRTLLGEITFSAYLDNAKWWPPISHVTRLSPWWEPLFFPGYNYDISFLLCAHICHHVASS